MLKFMLSLLLLSWSAAGSAAPAPVSAYVLENGLKVLVKPDHRAPVAVTMVWYKVGSSYEPNGITGVSHVLEHMMFQGTKAHPAGEFSRLIAENGGQENAFTGRDYTAYFQSIRRDKLALSFELEADRMQHLRLDPEHYKKELAVVKEERRQRVEDSPLALTAERFQAAAFLANPYHQPIIGWMSDLEQLTLTEVQQWYQRWYAPNNATLVVVGDVVPAEVKALAEKHFGSIPTRELPVVKAHPAVKPLGTRMVDVNANANLPYWLQGYNVPVLTQVDAKSSVFALTVLASVLSGGDSARLPKHLIREQNLATSIHAEYDPFSRLSDVFTISAIPAQGVAFKTLAEAVEQQLQRLKNHPIEAKELERAKTQLIAERLYAQDSLMTQAMVLGTLETVGLGWQTLDQFFEGIQSVTPEAIQRAAMQYLTPERLTVARLNPLPTAITSSEKGTEDDQ